MPIWVFYPLSSRSQTEAELEASGRAIFIPSRPRDSVPVDGGWMWSAI